jgi:hypothetical protein
MLDPSYAAIIDSTMTGTEKTIWVKIMSQIPERTRLKPLDPHIRRTDKPRDDVGIIRGILRMVLIKGPYPLRCIRKANGVAIHMAIYVELAATIIEVTVAFSRELK